TGIADCVATMVAGAAEPAATIVRALVAESAAADAAPEVPSGRALAAPDAALVNGVAGHVLDYDDVAMDGHPSVALAPAILAEGWSVGASGAEALAAYVAGYEVWAALLAREPGALHDRGFHPTGIWGTLAAAAACARLNRLNAEQAGHAIAIAASLASGLVANFGTMTKPLHAGRTAQAGVLAARLARMGYTASADALEHPTGGFLVAHSPSGRPDLSDADLGLGHAWRLAETGVDVKRYPICYATHRAIDAMIDLAETHALRPGDVGAIHVTLGETQRLMLRNRAPKTGLEAKFSIEFALAAALVARRVGLAELTDSFVQREDVAAAMRKVTCDTVPTGGAPFAESDRVAVVLRSGAEIAHAPVSHAKGSWKNPMNAAEFKAKFMDCTADVLGGNRATSLFESLFALDKAPSLRDLPLGRDTRH
ncbi:MAG TPA: MmgE/PrpD family protein, partial [Xanthobacteraceae bacterium]|nr:MmgE/PrpD family protein [Xanthobacteraceae bacterium]